MILQKEIITLAEQLGVTKTIILPILKTEKLKKLVV